MAYTFADEPFEQQRDLLLVRLATDLGRTWITAPASQAFGKACFDRELVFGSEPVAIANIVLQVTERQRSRGRRERLTSSINSTRRRTCSAWHLASALCERD